MSQEGDNLSAASLLIEMVLVALVDADAGEVRRLAEMADAAGEADLAQRLRDITARRPIAV